MFFEGTVENGRQQGIELGGSLGLETLQRVRLCLERVEDVGPWAPRLARIGERVQRYIEADVRGILKSSSSARNQTAHADILAAEKTLKTNSDEPRAALVVGSENVRVTCHRTDAEWR